MKNCVNIVNLFKTESFLENKYVIREGNNKRKSYKNT